MHPMLGRADFRHWSAVSCRSIRPMCCAWQPTTHPWPSSCSVFKKSRMHRCIIYQLQHTLHKCSSPIKEHAYLVLLKNINVNHLKSVLNNKTISKELVHIRLGVYECKRIFDSLKLNSIVHIWQCTANKTKVAQYLFEIRRRERYHCQCKNAKFGTIKPSFM